MEDLTSLSDEELMKIAGVSENKTDEPSSKPQDLSSASDEELMKIAGVSEEQLVKPTISQSLGTDQNVATSAVTEVLAGPIFELARGFNDSAAQTYEIMDGAAKLAQKVSGNVLNTEPAQKFFADAEEYYKEQNSKIPESQLWLNKAFYALGQAPGVTAQFAAIPISGVASVIGKMGVLEALNEFSKDEDFRSLASGAIKGATVGAIAEVGLRGAGKIIEKGWDIYNKFGEKAAKAYITFTTGNDTLARDFLKNPSKYDKVDPRPESDIVKEYNDKLFELRESAKIASKAASEKIQIRKKKLADEHQLAETRMKEANLIAKDEKSFESAAEIKALQDATNEAIATRKQVIDSEMEDIYSSFIEMARSMDEGVGQEVGVLKDKLLKQAKGVTISWDDFGRPILKAIENMPGMKMVDGKITPIDPTGPKKQLADRLNAIRNQLADFRQQGSVPLEHAYAMTRKSGSVEDLYAFAKENNLLSDFKDGLDVIKETVSLKNLKIDGVKMLKGSAEAKKTLEELVKKNKEFYEMRLKYDTAMRNYSSVDPVNPSIIRPDPQRALRAIKNNDSKVLKQMEDGDKLLPVEHRILPRMKQLASDLEKFENDKKSLLKVNERVVRRKQTNFERDMAKKQDELRKLNRNESFENQLKWNAASQRLASVYRHGLRRMQGEFEAQRDVVLGAKALDSWLAQQYGGVQAGTAIGSMYRPGPLAAVPILLAPKVAKTAVKIGGAGTEGLRRLGDAMGIKEALREENLSAIRRLIGVEK